MRRNLHCLTIISSGRAVAVGEVLVLKTNYGTVLVTRLSCICPASGALSGGRARRFASKNWRYPSQGGDGAAVQAPPSGQCCVKRNLNLKFSTSLLLPFDFEPRHKACAAQASLCDYLIL